MFEMHWFMLLNFPLLQWKWLKIKSVGGIKKIYPIQIQKEYRIIDLQTGGN